MSVAGVIGALFYLRVTSLRNMVIARFLRLKQPKYLIGAVVGITYFYFLIVRRVGTPRPSGPAALVQAFPSEQLPAVASFGAFVLVVFVALYWLLPRSRAALAFSEAEIAFLFPAPIGRRTLIHYRWINTQLRILFTSLLLALFTSPWTFLVGGAVIRVVGWWLILSTLDLHAVGSSFAITRLLDSGMTSLRRRLLVIVIATLALAGALSAAWHGLRGPTPEELAGPVSVAKYVASLLTTGPLSWLLLPATWVVRPLLAPSAGAFLAALGPALLVYALHYVWVLRSEVSFEEASIAKAEKRAARVRSMREGKGVDLTRRKAQRAPFKLSAKGRPELAFLWKNLLASATYLRPRVALIAAAVIIIGCGLITQGDHEVLRGVVAASATFLATLTLLMGSLAARQDLRLDLPNVDVLKTYPLRGWQIVLGEVLAPVATLTVLLWLMLLAVSLTLRPPNAAWWSPGAMAPAAIGAGLLLPFLCAVQVLVLNAAVVLFPAWVPMGPERGTGIDVFGQRIFFLAALLLTMVGALLPAAIAATAVFFLTTYIVGVLVAGGLAIVAALAVLIVELGLAVAWLGKRFESFDLSAELRP